ncbi:hypothetical protein CNMCM5623_002187 [Aspergillus felis]|uniref:Uncharacterized protein n=1 Tax=Aspergillus felis TaxID=1287682 RepID=A0A8H6QBU5_9EURO|nr:hypothetical protein CNMCM5623_002187 [Aspergillus felis]KAF7183739.1 hypothetical protein CNMCM7691_004089 [Aspergillus felis]
MLRQASPFTTVCQRPQKMVVPLSSGLFQPNYTATPLPDTNITVTSYHNIYIYTRSILWTAYGIALGVTLLSVVAGTVVYLSNHGSYSSKFSTIFRVTQGATVSVELNTEDCSGFDPLPDHLAKAQMTPGYDPGHSTGLSPVATQEDPSLRNKGFQVAAWDQGR